MQNETPQYETEKQHRDNPPPAPEEHKLGSAQPGADAFDAVANDPAGIPVEAVAADVRPRAVMPVEGLPPETQAVDFMTPDGRPVDYRPREVFPAEGR